MRLIRRCYECRRFYSPWWQGEGVIRVRDENGKTIEKPIHGHVNCLLAAFSSDTEPGPSCSDTPACDGNCSPQQDHHG